MKKNSISKLFDLTDKVVVLTGSAGRLGENFAHILSESGANVVLIDIDKKKNQILEKILHPKVRKRYAEFLKLAHRRRIKLSILNIPLLIEKKGYKCDKVIAIITSRSVQKYRFLKRCREADSKDFASRIPELEGKFQEIISKQINNLERKKHADFVIFNGLSRSSAIRKVESILHQLR